MPATDNGVVLTDIVPGAVRRIHLVGVAGTGMGAFAGMLKAAGYAVTGSDENVYPPMSDMLREWDIEVFTPYAAENIDRAHPELVIIGNVIRRTNPEAAAVRERGIPQMSFPAAFGALVVAGKHSVVIAGTHGKTTTSALMAHVLVQAGLDPTFLVGGVTVNYDGNFRLGNGQYVVVEGDEYDTAYFDKGPKFLHYRARTALLTSIEFDHADIYADMAHYELAYEKFCATLPEHGWLGVSASYPRAVEVARAHARSRVTTYGVRGDADYRAHHASFGPDGARFRIDGPQTDETEFLLPMSGYHNIENATGVYAAARSLGVASGAIGEAFMSFRGVKRRQEPRGEIGGVLVVDDFAHHPTAVRETIEGIRQRYPERRLWAVFEPRSNTSRRNIHQAEYAAAFDHADVVTIRLPEPHDKVPVDQQLDVPAIVKAIGTRHIVASALGDVSDITRLVSTGARANDLILVMSNGSFGGFIPSLLSSLGQRFHSVVGQSETHLASPAVVELLGARLHRDAVQPFLQLKEAARVAGFDLTVLSGFRSFDKQLSIWNRKATGQLAVLDNNARPLDIATLSERELVFAILRWSALPGASRHHWGTDVDIYDMAAKPADYEVDLLPAEVDPGGMFAPLHEWLDARIAEGTACGFYRPYDIDRHGVAPERWHLSYAPVSSVYERQLTPELLRETIQNADMMLKDVVLRELDAIFEQFVINTNPS